MIYLIQYHRFVTEYKFRAPKLKTSNPVTIKYLSLNMVFNTCKCINNTKIYNVIKCKLFLYFMEKILNIKLRSLNTSHPSNEMVATYSKITRL